MKKPKFVTEFYSNYVNDSIKDFCKERKIKIIENKNTKNVTFVSFVKKNLKELYEDYYKYTTRSFEITKYEYFEDEYTDLY